METVDFRRYLSLLKDLGDTLEQLTTIEQNKITAVENSDLQGLNDCMKQEQALSMVLRGYELKQLSLGKELGLVGISIGTLEELAPEDCVQETRQTAETLRRQYQLFYSAFEVAQNILECNLHEVEKILGSMGKDPNESIGYGSASPDLPPSMRADFRA